MLVVAHKVVSKAEGRTRRLNDIEPSERARELAREHAKDPRLVQAVLDETATAAAGRAWRADLRDARRARLRHAGVDQSNAPEGEVILLPEDPDASARVLRAGIAAARGVAPGDRDRRLLRAACTWPDGLQSGRCVVPLEDWRGRPDASGRELQATAIAVADAAAAAADLAGPRTPPSRPC